MSTNLNELAKDIAKWRKSKGFYTPDTIHEVEATLAKLMLVVTEVTEAAEAVRHGDHENFIEELADIIIRLLDITGTMHIDIEAAITTKMIVNRQRPYKHGKRI